MEGGKGESSHSRKGELGALSGCDRRVFIQHCKVGGGDNPKIRDDSSIQKRGFLHNWGEGLKGVPVRARGSRQLGKGRGSRCFVRGPKGTLKKSFSEGSKLLVLQTSADDILVRLGGNFLKKGRREKGGPDRGGTQRRSSQKKGEKRISTGTSDRRGEGRIV